MQNCENHDSFPIYSTAQQSFTIFVENRKISITKFIAATQVYFKQQNTV